MRTSYPASNSHAPPAYGKIIALIAPQNFNLAATDCRNLLLVFRSVLGGLIELYYCVNATIHPCREIRHSSYVRLHCNVISAIDLCWITSNLCVSMMLSWLIGQYSKVLVHKTNKYSKNSFTYVLRWVVGFSLLKQVDTRKYSSLTQLNTHITYYVFILK